MNFVNLPLQGLVVVERSWIEDIRGGFARLFCNKALSAILGERRVVQINQSKTTQAGTIRGMHFQYPPHAEMKMVSCLRGKVFDVAVDLRSGSDTFLKWHAEILTPENSRMFVIPEGFAHGFQTLEPDTELLYFHTAHYEPTHESGVFSNDPMLNIKWPLACSEISERDRQHGKIDSQFTGIKL